VEKAMTARAIGLVGGVVIGVFTFLGASWAQVRVVVTREESKPETVEINAGQEVEWLNASGLTAHVWFGPVRAFGFYIGPGGVRVKFERPGTYPYAVHLSEGTTHTHPGTVIVK
jgi:plastocyanin